MVYAGYKYKGFPVYREEGVYYFLLGKHRTRGAAEKRKRETIFAHLTVLRKMGGQWARFLKVIPKTEKWIAQGLFRG